MTGTTPFDKERLRTATYDEIRRIIREEEPPRPSTRFSTIGHAAVTVSANRQSDPKRLSQLFRGELDWIIMKALEKDRNRRYETANAFARDVERYLADQRRDRRCAHGRRQRSRECDLRSAPASAMPCFGLASSTMPPPATERSSNSIRNTCRLVSGGSRGIGRAIAQGFAERGASVVITGRDKASLGARRTRRSNASANPKTWSAPRSSGLAGLGVDDRPGAVRGRRLLRGAGVAD
jgi:hypothetical protein